MDKVDFALRRSRRAGRRVLDDFHSVNDAGCIFDVEVEELHVGVMPFLYFGGHCEESPRKVRVFWTHAVIPGRRSPKPRAARELVVLGSLDNVVNESWWFDESSLKIGHEYPSDPSALSRFVQAELCLTDASVQEHVKHFGRCDEGDPARLASEQTRRAYQTIEDDETAENEPGFATTWERRRPLRKARVVATCNDIGPADEESAAESAVLARPVLIQDLT